MKTIQRVFYNPNIWLGIFSVFYFILRLTNLKSLPIFTDEAIYIRWSQIGVVDASWRFISLTDGKQPLFTWFVMAALRFIHDPLVAGRLVSVGAGFFTMIGMYFLGREIFGRKRIGILASLLYLISPFALMYDRLAIYDSMVGAFSVWNLYIAILLVKHVRLDLALIFGLSLGVGMLNKTSAFFSLYLVPGTLLIFDRSRKARLTRFSRWILLVLLAALLSQAVYGILRLSPYFYIVAQKNTIFVYPFREWIQHPFTNLYWNLHGLFDWVISYMTIPLFIAALVSFIADRKQQAEKFLLLGWWFFPFFALALFGKVLYPRFILFMTMPLYVLAAYTIDRIIIRVKNRTLLAVLIVLLVYGNISMSWGILTDIKHARLPKSEIGQYVNEWPSGWGVAEIVGILETKARSEKVAVYTEGTFGLLPYALEIYLHNNPNIEIHGVWPPPLLLPEDIRASAAQKNTYYITNLTQTKPDWNLTLMGEFQKGDNPKSHIRLYKIDNAVAK